MAASIAELARAAPEDAVALARSILEQSLADHDWASQLGPALTQRDVAGLLGKSEQAVSKDPRLLRLRNRDGRPVYPVFQFDGRALVDGFDEAVAILDSVAEPLTVAAWFTGSQPDLDDKRPIDALRSGDIARVIGLAGRFAARAER